MRTSPSEARSDSRVAGRIGPVLAVLVGLLLTLEIFEAPLFSIFIAGTDVTRLSEMQQQLSLLALVANLAICALAAARLVLLAPGPAAPPEQARLGRGETACLLLTSLTGCAMVSSAATVWWAMVRLKGWNLSHTDELVKNLPRLVSCSSFHALLVVVWLAWYDAEYRRRGKPKSAAKARGAGRAVVIALGAWWLSGPHLESSTPLLIGLTAMIYATVQAARMQLQSAQDPQPSWPH